MRPFKRIHELSRYLLLPRRSLGYIGIVGIHNLGDEAVYEAIRGYFYPFPVMHCRPPRYPRFLRDRVANKPHVGKILGGGTLIGCGSLHGNPCLDEFERATGRSAATFVFTTGVSGIDFADREGAKKQMLDRWQNSLRRAAYIGVRGPDSAATLHGWGLRAEVIGDAACRFVQPESYWQPTKRKLGINVGRSANEFPELYESMATFIADRARERWEVEFFVVWPEDLIIAEKVIRLAGIDQPRIHKVYRHIGRYLSLIRQMQVFVGLKLHSVILAMCAGVPSLMLDYNPKCLDFMKSVGMETFNLQLNDVTPGMLDEKFAALLIGGNHISKALYQKLSGFMMLQMARARFCVNMAQEMTM